MWEWFWETDNGMWVQSGKRLLHDVQFLLKEIPELEYFSEKNVDWLWKLAVILS